MVFAEEVGVPGNAFAITGFFAFVLMKAEWFMKKAKAMGLWSCIGIGLMNIVCALLLANGLFEKSRIVSFLLSDLSGCLLLALLVKLMPEKESKVVAWLSGISFELYLVHHTLCAGPFIRITHWPFAHIINFALMTVGAAILAIVLSFIAKRVSLIFKTALFES